MYVFFLSLRLAIGLYRGQSRNNIVSLIYIFSVIGIALGVAVLIIGLSAMNGFQYQLEHRILAMIPHVEIESTNTNFVDWQLISDRIKKIPDITSIMPYVYFTGLIGYKNKLHLVHIKGIDSFKILEIPAVKDAINKNVWPLFKNGYQQILLGKGIADILKVQQGDWVTIILPNIYKYSKFISSRTISLKVIGILPLDSQLDQNFALIPLKDAVFYFDQQYRVEGIAIRASNIFQIDELIFKIKTIINTNKMSINSWMHKYGHVYKDIQIVRTIIYLSMVLIILISSVGIAVILMVSVKEKSNEIAILKCLGARGLLIQFVFIWCGLFIGLFGSVVGMCFGILISYNLTELGNKLQYFVGHKLLPGDIYFIDFLPSVLLLSDIKQIIVIELLFSLFMSWYPALYASRIEPVKILK
ncbi:lipoprotein-releasing ABC transporter permease subunit LolE [Blochmannia endosymbiont of Colobopsis nipponica]|uniref:lipoprotein-releasing ABC transporter permease subunit LolE n=1 Tax=Blochmannia endosymbiont of Colobopsis nipponica TaxID=2681987 RepID=UPI00177B06B5|nr:lipoprotein-releasing ABC transporter permease subunit LolE [Blochmannia endosymbiont of Colobopsis nipponica]QOI11058.1 lipoprotein-releasing ABC transporter permease subunit LolE [Blochmannia endosymbiont of Colobopsis nipponica]